MNPPVAVDKAAAGGLRLNLGGRSSVLPGFKTVDLKEGPTVDYVADISELKMFENGTVDEIYASHCLEHFPHTHTLAVLKEWRRVLRDRARCYIAVPDVDAAVRLIGKEGLTDFIRNLLWGDQEYVLAFHFTGFTFASLARILTQAGFHDVKRLNDMPYGVVDCSKLVDNHYYIPISLNVEAIA